MSDAQQATNAIFDAYESRLTRIGGPAVGIQLALMVGVGLAAIIGFSVLRPNNSVVYQPKLKYAADDKRPPKIGKGIFDWVRPVLTLKEQEMMVLMGLDSVAYLRFLRMCRNMFICIAALTCAILIPVNVVYNLRYVKEDNRNYLLILTMSKVKGNWLWAHVVATYVLTFMAFFFIWTNYDAIVRLRWQWFRSPAYQDMLYARSLMITQVNKKFQTDAGLAGLLSSLNIPYPTSAVHIGRRFGALPALIKKHNEAVEELEHVLTTYFKNPNRLPTQRPVKRIGGHMGLGGQKVDAIDYLTEKIKRLEQRVDVVRAQINERKAENYGFASFESVPYAHIVAKTLRGRRRHGAHFDLAPQPKDLIWDNLQMTDATRTKNKFFGGILLVLLCGFYTIPLVAVALLANLAALSAYVGFINTWINDYPWLFSAFVGIVPPILTFLLQMVLPIIIRWIASLQGATTHSQSDRIVTARYSAFLFITQFIIFSLLGVIVQVVSQIVIQIQGHASASKIWDYLQTVPDKLQNTYMIQSTYWLTVFPLRGASACFDLAQIISLLIIWFKTRMFGRTPREIREATKPPYFDFPVYYSNHLLVVAVAMVYAPIAPLVGLFGAGVFAVSYYVYKYQNLYVSVPRTETGGRLWNVVVNRVLTALILMHIFMAVSIGLQTNWFYAIALAPPAVCVLIFKVILDRKFIDRFRWYIPGEVEMAEVHMHRADARKNRLEKRFGHDALSEPLWTPMLHKNVQHLLPTIYNGRIEQGETKVGGKTVEQNMVGGLTFAMMEAHDLTVDRAAYLREREEDEMTISTAFNNRAHRPGAPSVAGTDVDDYFGNRHAEYLKHGAAMSRSGKPFNPGTPEELPEELQRMPTYDDQTPGSYFGMDGRTTPNASTDNLIQQAQPYQYPPSYSSPDRTLPHHARGMSGSPRIGGPPIGHRTNASQTSFSSVGAYDPAMQHAHPLDLAQYGRQGPPPPIGMTRGPGARSASTDSYGGQWQPQHAAARSQQSIDFAYGAGAPPRGDPRRMSGPYAAAGGPQERLAHGVSAAPSAYDAAASANFGSGGAPRYAPLHPDGTESAEYLPQRRQ
ncbi:DUF221 domain containing protein [Rhodotorula toruloides]|uniref:DUF221 domain containing protein n=1 Tax=Rhodotorula toruloides TaxID=5286 RepID=A0A511KMA6_RHOTO|nr:DUF221 domain containing protein [Rhodotorula toruloides]